MNTNIKVFKLTYLSVCLTSLFVTQIAVADEETTSNVEASNTTEVVKIIGSRQAYQGDFTRLETPQSNLEIDSEALLNAFCAAVF